MSRLMPKWILMLVVMASAFVVAQERGIIRTRGNERFETAFSAGGQLKLEVRSGEVHIKGTDDKKISIHYEGRNSDDLGDVAVKYRNIGSGGEMKISGGPRNEFQIWIEVPRETDLYVRMPFGSLGVERVRGNKDLEIHAGELTMDAGDTDDYAEIDTSVTTGELNLSALGVSKGGLFRSYKKDGPGKYKLYAHVGSGQIDLE